MEKYSVSGMSCAACQMHVEKAVSKVPGVTSCTVSLLTNSMAVEGTASEKDIVKAVEDAGYGAKPMGADGASGGGSAAAARTRAGSRAALEAEEEALKDTETPKMVKRLVSSVMVLIILMYFSMGHMMWGWPVPAVIGNHVSLGIIELLLTVIILFLNRNFFVSGYKGLFHGAPNMDTLVALGSTAAFGYSLVALFLMADAMSRGDMETVDMLAMKYMYFETAAMIPTLITIGKTLESYSKGRTTDALKGLMKLAPKTAVVERDGAEVEIDIDNVAIGDIFVVKPGAAIPVDGIVVEGATSVNESALTGESIPVDKTEGDVVSAATVNESGFIKARATRVGEDTTLSQIIAMVSDAAATKAPIARIADKVSSVFVPVVMLIALATLIGWLIAGVPFGSAFSRAVSVLVISCPCALGLATPVAIMVGNGIGAKNGILYKTAAALEAAGRTEIVALDKTGTITTGNPAVTDILPAEGVARDELLETAYVLEKKSEHPLAKAVVTYCEEDAENYSDSLESFEALPGNGLRGNLSGAEVVGGSFKYASSAAALPADAKNFAEELGNEGKTPLVFLKEGRYLGIIAVADAMKEESPEAIRQLKALGVKVVMLTGDNVNTARAVGRAAGVDRVIAGVLPAGKEEVIRDLQKSGKVAMVGDGINDAPALTRAETGIAIGAGTDVAIDAADVVLVKSRLTDVPAAIRLSRAVVKNIHENLFWAFFYNALCIPLAIGLYQLLFHWGFEMKPAVGALAMSFSSVTVCLNALRLNLFKPFDSRHDKAMRKKAGNTTGRKGSSGAASDDWITDASEGRTADKGVNASETSLNGHTNTEITETAASGSLNTNQENSNEKETNEMTKTISIEGMMCEHCEATVKKALEALDGVDSAEVSHEKGTAVVSLSGAVSDEAMKEAVEAKDYKVTKIA